MTKCFLGLWSGDAILQCWSMWLGRWLKNLISCVRYKVISNYFYPIVGCVHIRIGSDMKTNLVINCKGKVAYTYPDPPPTLASLGALCTTRMLI